MTEPHYRMVNAVWQHPERTAIFVGDYIDRGPIIGSAMKVHSALGSGFQEVIYPRALAVAFRKQGIALAI